MKFRSTAIAATGLAILLVPAIAFAGVRPPENSSWAATGTSNSVSTGEDGDSNNKAEKVEFAATAIYKCGNNVPVVLENRSINRKGKYRFDGKIDNLAGQTVELKVRGVFKNANKVVQTTTIYKGNCEKTIRVAMPRQEFS